jgi:hypothetical protein
MTALNRQGEGKMDSAKRLLVTAACSLAVAAVGAGSAFAGEITGNGKWIAGSETAPLRGKSECAYSGRNDNSVLGNELPDEDGFTRTQSWGQVGREGRIFLTSIGLNPGMACNPSKSG